jgi:hypothetical protein
VSFFAVEQWVKRDLAGQTGTSFRTTLEDKKKRGLFRPKRRPGQLDRAPFAFAAQYRQETSKNNAFFRA